MSHFCVNTLPASWQSGRTSNASRPTAAILNKNKYFTTNSQTAYFRQVNKYELVLFCLFQVFLVYLILR